MHSVRNSVLIRRATPIAVALCVLAAAEGSAQAGGGGAAATAPPQGTSTTARANAYADVEAHEMVRLARIRRAMVDRRIEAYETTVVERISAGLGMGVGERLLYRRETATRVNWTPDTVRIEVLGAREVVPSVSSRVQVPAALSQTAASIAFDPVDSEMLLRLDNTDLKHPFAADAETHYRFAAGDSTVIRLPDGRAVRLRELRITPRQSRPDLIAGSFWLDMDTHAVVQAYFRLARPMDSRLGDADALPFLPTRMELDYIAVDYGLWEQRWWLPRTLAAQGVMEAGPFRIPVRFERRYDDYTVSGIAVDLATSQRAPEQAPDRPCRPATVFSIQVGTRADTTAAMAQTDTVDLKGRRPRADARTTGVTAAVPADGGAAADSADAEAAGTACNRAFIVNRPAMAELLANELLPGSIYDGASPALSQGELDALAARLRRIPAAPWQLTQPRLHYGVSDGLLRYNRVEGVSLAVRPRLDLGPAWVDGELRWGAAGSDPGLQLGAGLRAPGYTARINGYHRLDATDLSAHPFGIGSSLSALVLGRDDADYFRSTGAEVMLAPSAVRRQWYDLRLFAERQRSVETATDFHVRRIADGARVFRPNPPALEADQFGMTLRLRLAGHGSASAPRWAGELDLLGETGDATFARPTLRLRSGGPLGRFVSIGVESAVGTIFGDAPPQREWRLGGASTLRGYDFGAATGEAFWNARGELAFGPRFLRLVPFADVGWAGPRSEATAGRPLRSAGVGVSLLDGVFRMDIARGRQPGGWKVYFRLDGVL